ncbi:MAG: DUF5713 family protein [Saprospiraceae bacterium]|nr:DUF5713 family protein [Saprospiraceae bacterium]
MKMERNDFLKGMSSDRYYPQNLVEKGKDILTSLSEEIGDTNPKDLDQLYELTHQATEKFNSLEREFFKQGSEIETIARECIANDFMQIAKNHGFDNADIEELIAPREW